MEKPMGRVLPIMTGGNPPNADHQECLRNSGLFMPWGSCVQSIQEIFFGCATKVFLGGWQRFTGRVAWQGRCELMINDPARNMFDQRQDCRLIICSSSIAKASAVK